MVGRRAMIITSEEDEGGFEKGWAHKRWKWRFKENFREIKIA